jgi:two-component system, chemotaxis family, response regulator WspF
VKVALVLEQLAAIDGLRHAIAREVDLHLCWTATEAAQATTRADGDRPELALVSASLPGGVALTRALTACGCRVLVIADSTAAGQADTFDLMVAGAVDVAVVPGAAAGRGDHAALRPKLALMRRLHRGAARTPTPRAPTGDHPPIIARAAGAESTPIVALGASTGGPQALAAVLSGLPRTLAASVLIVQHIDPDFGASLVEWLHRATGFAVEVASVGLRPRPATAYVAVTGQHLLVEADGTLGASSHPANVAHRPSIDVLFDSLRRAPQPGVAALLTGMGKDGAVGLAALRRAGWTTIAQDERSSVVYGMPKAAVELGAACSVLALDQIGPEIGRVIATLGGHRASPP